VSRAVVLPSGQILDGRYRVDEPVGEGGFATVYAGLHLTLGVRVAIKALHLDGLEDPEREADRFADFIDEGKLVTRLRHDHIVRTLDQGIFRPPGGGRAIPYLVLEWCGEESLEGRLRRDAKMTLREAYEIVAAVTDAMAHAHEASVVHRDIKPANVMLAHGARGELVPRVIDFGVAKVFEGGDASLQTATQSAGKYTPAYAAPEQLAGMRSGPFTDVHAIGLLFYELATGRQAFSNESALGNVDPERPTPARVGVDVGAFEPVIAKAVALRPADRYPDARALARALEEAARSTDFARASHPVAIARASERSTDTVPPTSHTANAPIAPRRSPMIAAAVVAFALGLSGLYVVRSRGHVDSSRPPAKEKSAIVEAPAPKPLQPEPLPSTAPEAHVEVPLVPSSSKAKKPVAPPVKSAEKPTKVENAPSAPSASVSKGVGGIVETPPF
jgi:serine/threonine-protein kinase